MDKLWNAKKSEVKNMLDNNIANLILEAKEKYDPNLELEKIQKLNIGYITIKDKNYPEILKELPDAPVVLYVMGNIDVIKLPSIAFVGSRKYSSYGARVCKKLICEMRNENICIVSGLALGIDAIAHRSALNNGLKTVGVLGCGLDRVYPASNFLLSKEILENDGAVISEFPPGTPPMKHHFPARNRIIAGLSLGTVVVEAAEKSGALITALEALDYNREVFAVPGDVGRETSKGCNRLIQEGAKLITGADDIFEELNIKKISEEKKSQEIIPGNKIEGEILKIISDQKIHVDKIVEKSKHNIVEISSALTTLEMKGNLENVGGGYWIKTI